MSNQIPKKTIFFAYQSPKKNALNDNVNTIKKIEKESVQYHKPYHIKTWDHYQTAGMTINNNIIRGIKEADIFACDITYLNHNVLFELGYAIGQKKPVHIFLNNTISDSEINYKKTILSNTVYHKFTNSTNLTQYFDKNYDNKDTTLAQYNKVNDIKDFDIFYIPSSITTESSSDLTKAIKDLKCYECVTIHRSEMQYHTLGDYIKKILYAKSLIVHFLPKGIQNSYIENADNSIIAGIAYGLDKKIALIADSKNEAPLDYIELVVEYIDNYDCAVKTIEWINYNISKNEPLIQNHISKQKSEEEEQLDNILKLGLFFKPIAEDESELPKYFIDTVYYNKALNNTSSLVLFGKKGVGKSAIYFKLLSDLKIDNKNIIVSLYPDSEDLNRVITFVTQYANKQSRKSFFTLIWRYVIYSRLALEIYEDLLNSKIINEDNDLFKYVETNKTTMEYNFVGFLYYLNKKYSEKDIDIDNKLLEILQSEYIKPLAKHLAQHILKDKFCKIVILADNLDQIWNANENVDIQVDMIQALMEIQIKIAKELNVNINSISIIIFLRKDIYINILNRSHEKDKTNIRSDEINWEKYPYKLQEIVEERLKHSLMENNLPIQDDIIRNIWSQYFNLTFKKNRLIPIEAVKQYVAQRPRDYILFFSHMFEKAAENNKKEITNSDFKYAKIKYLDFFKDTLITELSTNYKHIEEIVAHMFSYNDNIIEYKTLKNFLKNKKYKPDEIIALIREFYESGFIVITTKKEQLKHVKWEEFSEHINDKKFIFFDKNNYLLVLKKWQND